MKIRIDSKGNLHLENRAVRCPLCSMAEPCGALCALFTVAITCDGKAADIGLCHRSYSISIDDFAYGNDEESSNHGTN